MIPPRHARLLAAALALLASTTAWLWAQSNQGDAAVTIVSAQGRQSIATRQVDGREMVALDDLAQAFQLQVREDPLAGGLTVSRGSRTLVMSSEGLVSSGGRLVSLSPPVKQGRSWLVPLDFLARGLPLVLDERAEYRRATRTLLIGDVSLPRVVVRTEAIAGTQRVTVDISPRTDHAIVQEPGRLLVRFSADAVDADIGPHAASDLLSALRLVGGPPPALALDLGPRYASFRASNVPVDASSTRVVIDILPAGGAAVTGPTTTAPTPPSPDEVPALPVFEGPVTGVRTIVIDPGHGGDEQGARGPRGTLEKDVTLAVARQLRATIEARLGLRVLLTRDGDQTVPLDARAALANNNKADLFVSLHANASVSPSPSGAEVFFLSLQEYGERAAREAVPDSVTVPSLGGVDRQVELILWEMAQARHLEDSSVLAEIVERQLRSRVAMSARAIQQAPFRVLVGANMPAVLVEMGFLTNPGEESRLTSGAHQATLVQALYESIVAFRSYIEGGRRRPAPAAAPGGGTGR